MLGGSKVILIKLVMVIKYGCSTGSLGYDNMRSTSHRPIWATGTGFELVQ